MFESACTRRTFAEQIKQVPTRARCTARLKVVVLEAVVWVGRAVLEVASSFGMAWWTVLAVATPRRVSAPEIEG